MQELIPISADGARQSSRGTRRSIGSLQPERGSGEREPAPYGKVWLTPYSTNKSSAQSHPTAYTWYAESIVSRNPITDP
jgi:hypothetical protein